GNRSDQADLAPGLSRKNKEVLLRRSEEAMLVIVRDEQRTRLAAQEVVGELAPPLPALRHLEKVEGQLVQPLPAVAEGKERVHEAPIDGRDGIARLAREERGEVAAPGRPGERKAALAEPPDELEVPDEVVSEKDGERRRSHQGKAAYDERA